MASHLRRPSLLPAAGKSSKALSPRLSNSLTPCPPMPLGHVVEGWPRFRRYAPRMLRALDMQTSSAGEPIVAALRNIAAGSPDMPPDLPAPQLPASPIPGGISI